MINGKSCLIFAARLPSYSLIMVYEISIDIMSIKFLSFQIFGFLFLQFLAKRNLIFLFKK